MLDDNEEKSKVYRGGGVVCGYYHFIAVVFNNLAVFTRLFFGGWNFGV